MRNGGCGPSSSSSFTSRTDSGLDSRRPSSSSPFTSSLLPSIATSPAGRSLSKRPNHARAQILTISPLQKIRSPFFCPFLLVREFFFGLSFSSYCVALCDAADFVAYTATITSCVAGNVSPAYCPRSCRLPTIGDFGHQRDPFVPSPRLPQNGRAVPTFFKVP